MRKVYRDPPDARVCVTSVSVSGAAGEQQQSSGQMGRSWRRHGAGGGAQCCCCQGGVRGGKHSSQTLIMCWVCRARKISEFLVALRAGTLQILVARKLI